MPRCNFNVFYTSAWVLSKHLWTAASICKVPSHSCQIHGSFGSSKEMGRFKPVLWGQDPSAHHERVLSLYDNAILKIYCKSY